MKGRKRQIVVETAGTFIRTLVHPANKQDKLEDEHNKLLTEINIKSLNKDQIRTLQEFAA